MIHFFVGDEDKDMDDEDEDEDEASDASVGEDADME